MSGIHSLSEEKQYLREKAKRFFLRARHFLESEKDGEGIFVQEKFGPKICLSFDDGPVRPFTADISSFLKSQGIQAPFFILGWRVQKYPDLIRKLDEDGHIIGNHTFTHPKLVAPTAKLLEQEINKTQDAIDNVLKDRYPNGYPYRYFRPPFGLPWTRGGNVHDRKMVRNFLRENEMKTVLWQVDSEDWSFPPAEAITAKVFEHLDPNVGGVILRHGTHDSTLPSLISILERARREGYEIVKLEELWAMRRERST